MIFQEIEGKLNQLQLFLQNNPNGLFYVCLPLFLIIIIAAIKDWNWLFDPPYNSVKNPIGYFFGRKAFRIFIIILSFFGIIVICIPFLIKLKII